MFECLYVFGSAVGTFFVFSGFLLRFLPCLLPRLLPRLLLYFQIAAELCESIPPKLDNKSGDDKAADTDNESFSGLVHVVQSALSFVKSRGCITYTRNDTSLVIATPLAWWRAPVIGSVLSAHRPPRSATRGDLQHHGNGVRCVSA